MNVRAFDEVALSGEIIFLFSWIGFRVMIHIRIIVRYVVNFKFEREESFLIHKYNNVVTRHNKIHTLSSIINNIPPLRS